MMSRTGLLVVVSTRSATFGRHVRHPRVHVPHRHVVVVRSNSLNTLTKEFDRCLRNMRCLQKSSMVSAFCAYMPAMSRPHCKIDIAGICAKCAHHDGSSRSDSCVGLLFQPMYTICLKLTSPRRHGGVAHAHAGDAHDGRSSRFLSRPHLEDLSWTSWPCWLCIICSSLTTSSPGATACPQVRLADGV